ncbi:MAG: hypothetical protein ACREHE_00435 [Rhizomicrobium sp.]
MSLGSWARAGLAAAALACIAWPASADPGFFFGHWSNVHPDTNNVTKIIIQPGAGGDIKVRAFGQCHPTDCDWGVTDGHYENGFMDEKIKAEFNSGFSITKLVVHRAGGDLDYDAHTHFIDGSGRAPYEVHGHFYRMSGYGGGYGPPGGGGPGGGYGPPGGGGYGPPGPPPGPPMAAEDCIGFNPSGVAASFVGGEWKVVDGGMWMLSYGGDSGAAHHAADVIHHYHFNQQCFVKRPNASMMYWKSGGNVPSGNTPGQDCIGLDPAHAHAAHEGGAWKVVADGNWLLDYGSDHAAAEQASAVIHTYMLNRQCFIVRPNAAMQYWLSQ